MSVLGHLLLSDQDGYTISRSVRLRSSASAYFNRTPASAGNRQKFTVSVWYKAGGISSGSVNANILNAGGDGSSLLIAGTGAFGATYQDRLMFREAGTTLFYWPMVFRDPSAWYHIVFAMDTTQATAANRAKLYVNGVDQGAFSGTAITQNTNTSINNTSAHYINTFNGTNYPSDLYYTEYNFIDGQQLTPTSFGQFNSVTGVWQPIKYTGTYGTNGFYLNFSDNSNNTATTIGKDYSGNGNNWTPNNISVTSGVTYDSMIDVPTPYADGGNGRGNYCVLNPLDFSSGTVSNGNTQWATTAAVGNGCFGSFAFDVADATNKYYWEMTITSGDGVFGIVPLTTLPSNTSRPGSYSYYTNGNKYSGTSASAYGSTFTSGDVIGVAVGNGSITFYKNNVSQGSAFTGLTGFFKPAIWEVSGTFQANFGQRPFAYTPPSGFVALNTQNLPAPTISNGALYMAATTYTGNGTYPTTITNGGNNTIGTTFQPDLVWMKARSIAYDNVLYDSVRGTGTGASLVSNSTAVEGAGAVNINMSAFASNGFTIGSTSSTNILNANGQTFVAWQWQAGKGTTSSNTSGSITSTVSVNATAGFSVVTYTGIAGNVAKTFGHGLGVAPSMVIIKPRTTASAFNAWVVWHSAFTGSEYIYLDLTNAKATSANYWGATVPSSTVVTVGGNSSNVSNESGINYVAYCFSAVAGYSAFGSYTGNGSTDGPFIFTGFRPRFVMIKRTDAIGDWYVFDTGRDSYNATTNGLIPNSSGTDTSYTGWGDILSNGFKIRRTDGAWNASGGSYLYACFAESPFKLSLAR